MYSLLLTAHVIICVLVIVLVLLQNGKGAEMGATFSGASGTMFGSQGSVPFLTKLITVCAALFFISSLNLNYLVGKQAKGASTHVMQEVVAGKQPAPPPSSK